MRLAKTRADVPTWSSRADTQRAPSETVRWAMQEERFFTRGRPTLLADAIIQGATGEIQDRVAVG